MTWKFEKVAGPFQGRTGGLAWDGKAMLFSAVQEERLYRFDPATGKTDVFRKYTGRVNGLAIGADGTVFGAQEGGRRIVRFMKDGSTAPTSELLDGRHHNQPTDVILDRAGRAWCADPYNAVLPFGPPVYKLLEHASVLRLDRVGPSLWKLRRMTYETVGPRAVLLSRDEKTLYVADGDVDRGDVCQLLAYPVDAHGELGPVKVLISLQYGERGFEGMCLEAGGNIIACQGWAKSGCGAAIHLISPEGTILESHPAPADMPMRCAFGDAGLASLYVTAGDGALYRATATGRKGLAR